MILITTYQHVSSRKIREEVQAPKAAEVRIEKASYYDDQHVEMKSGIGLYRPIPPDGTTSRAENLKMIRYYVHRFPHDYNKFKYGDMMFPQKIMQCHRCQKVHRVIYTVAMW